MIRTAQVCLGAYFLHSLKRMWESLLEAALVHNYKSKTVFKYALCTKDTTCISGRGSKQKEGKGITSFPGFFFWCSIRKYDLDIMFTLYSEEANKHSNTLLTLPSKILILLPHSCYEYFAYMYACVPCAHLVPTMARRRHQIPPGTGVT